MFYAKYHPDIFNDAPDMSAFFIPSPVGPKNLIVFVPGVTTTLSSAATDFCEITSAPEELVSKVVAFIGSPDIEASVVSVVVG